MMIGLSVMSHPARVAAAVGRTVRELHSPRVIWRGESRTHIAVRGIGQQRGAALARAVQARLERHPGVSWAAVNAPRGVVVVAHRADVPVADLVGVVEQLERDHPAQPDRAADRPAPVDRVQGSAIALAASVAGISLAGLGRAVRTVRLPAELGSLVQLVDTQPRLRGVVERAAGQDEADLLLAAGNALAQSAAQGLGGLALDAGQRVVQLAEAVMQRDAWARSEPTMCADPHRASAPAVARERPRPLPPGPVERCSELIGLGGAVAFGGVLAASGSPRRAAGVGLAGLPKAARLGREGFAAALGCVLAGRGAVVTDHRVLRLLERIDTIVIDADVLASGDQPAGRADLLLAAAARAEARFLLAGPAAAASGPAAAGVLPDGRRLVASIRGLQADGAVVLLVSRQRRALAAADCGVGLSSADGRPAWGAHILIGDDLTAAGLVIDAVRAAHEASSRGVRLAQAGSGLGAALAFGGAASDAAVRSLMAVNGAGAIALTGGAWSAARLIRRPVPAAGHGPPWHAMPTDVVLSRLRSRDTGLSSHEAQARWRPDERQPKELSLPHAFLAELANPLTPILAGGAVLSASIGAVADAVIVSGVCGASALMGGVQRVYTERSLARLLRASAVTARVLRDGGERIVPAARLVPGDIVLVGAQEVIPADCRLLDTQALQVDESSVTGESFPVDKTTEPVSADAIADRRSMLYEGTAAAAGRARAVVVATGSDTEMGRSLADLPAVAPVTGVEARLARITRTTLPLALGSAGAVVAAGWLRGRPARDTIGAAVGLAVASVPEGLPFLVTAAQLAAARRLGGRGALVRNPRTIEALGRVNVLCFDKTGTLTQGRMAVAAVSDGAAVRRPGVLTRPHRQVLAAALRATPPARAGRRAQHMTDQAVASGAAAERVTRSDGYPGWRRADTLPFEPSRGYHATLGSTRGGPLLSVKGAPEVVLPRCARWRGRALGPRDRKRLGDQLGRLAGDGYRILAVAENHVPAGTGLSDLGGLSLAGLVAFGDPVRATAGASVRDLRDAGVHVVMITGDHPATAAAIAAELDVVNGGTVVTGSDLDRLDDSALIGALAKATVIARCTPAHKVRVVRAYQAAGRVVAMTGDGANDAAAIRLADVGIALGGRATPAARAAADLVVTDDRLETILSAVVEGRSMWRSVRQAIGILVGGNIGEIGYTLLGALLTGTSPLTARQLLLVNLLTDLAPAMAVALGTAAAGTAADLLAEGPDTSLGSALTEEIAVRAIATAAAASSAWLAARLTGRAARARTVGLAALIGTELGQTLLVGWRSPTVVAASLVSAGILVVVVQTPGVSQFFGCTPLGPVGWATAAGSTLAGTAGSLLLPGLGRSLEPAFRSVVGSAPAAQFGSAAAGLRTRASQLLSDAGLLPAAPLRPAHAARAATAKR
jgi:cation-transporting P-type ATPase I